MSYDEEQHRRSRVVIETPTERREVVQHQTVRAPERRGGYSTGMVAAIALTAIAATAIVFLFLMNRSDDSSSTNVSVNTRAAAQPTPYVQQQPVIVQPTPLPATVTVPPPATAATPVIIIQQVPAQTGAAPAAAPPASSAPPASAANDETAVQARLDRAFRDDRALLDAGVTVTFLAGRATINGAVSTEALKDRAERLAYSIKGVQSVDNRITVVPSNP